MEIGKSVSPHRSMSALYRKLEGIYGSISIRSNGIFSVEEIEDATDSGIGVQREEECDVEQEMDDDDSDGH